jgi:hypothetical protein
MRISLAAICASTLLAAGAFAAKEELLITNADYFRFGKPPTPTTDALLLNDTLEALRFEVIPQDNASKHHILEAVHQFKERLAAKCKGIAWARWDSKGPVAQREMLTSL